MLLSVSSPFPANSSTPPDPIDVASDSEFAFLSTLELAAGAIKELPSPSELVTVPKVTASTSAPVSAGSFLRPTLLLLETVSAEILSHVKLPERAVLHHR